MLSNYIKKQKFKNYFLHKFLLLYVKIKIKFLIYFNFCFLLLQGNLFFFKKKKLNAKVYFMLNSKFELGLARDVVKFNLFFFKYSLLWYKLNLYQLKKSKKINLTLLRSPFVNKKARLQYCFFNYKSYYIVFLKHFWLLYYILLIVKLNKLLRYSKLMCSYSYLF